jgi:hypothetical protein
MIQIFVNIDPALREVGRVERLWNSGRVKGAFAAALTAKFVQTQSDVHVITGHLKASGQVEVSTRGQIWTGEITYGVIGDANWAKDPQASYAEFERNRDGSHDFVRALYSPPDLIEAALHEGLAR